MDVCLCTLFWPVCHLFVLGYDLQIPVSAVDFIIVCGTNGDILHNWTGMLNHWLCVGSPVYMKKGIVDRWARAAGNGVIRNAQVWNTPAPFLLESMPCGICMFWPCWFFIHRHLRMKHVGYSTFIADLHVVAPWEKVLLIHWPRISLALYLPYCIPKTFLPAHLQRRQCRFACLRTCL